MMEFNINQTAKVKLSGYGIEILMKRHYEFQERMENMNPDYVKKPFTLKLDEEGYYESQLWRIMETFGGDNMGMSKHPFGSQIILESR